MHLIQSVGPNPRVATMFLAEKGIALPRRFIDVIAGENRRPEFLARNPAGGSPVLEMDDGTWLADSVAICEYLDEVHPEPPLIGRTALERAQTRSVLRLIDHSVVVPLTMGFRAAEGLAMFKDRMLCIHEAAGAFKAHARDGLSAVERRLAAGGPYLCGERFTLADIVLFAFVDFGTLVGQPLEPANQHLKAWVERVGERPSAAISANPANGT
jgi:glutathione S-transferase